MFLLEIYTFIHVWMLERKWMIICSREVMRQTDKGGGNGRVEKKNSVTKKKNTS